MAFLDDSKSISHRDTCTSMLTAVLLIIAKLWDQPTCPSADRINCGVCIDRNFSAMRKSGLLLRKWV